MDINQLEKEAKEAVDRHNSSLYKGTRIPVVQIWNTHKLPDSFPIPMVYIGYHKNKHVYNLDALQILKYIERYRAEF